MSFSQQSLLPRMAISISLRSDCHNNISTNKGSRISIARTTRKRPTKNQPTQIVTMGRCLFGTRTITCILCCYTYTVLALSLSCPSNEVFISRNGRRCRIIKATMTGGRLNVGDGDDSNTDGEPRAPPPLVLVGGMSQSLTSWDHHIPTLSRTRDVILYECLGQGPEYQSSNDANVTLPRQAEMLWETLDELLHSNDDGCCDNKHYVVDMAGFSFGGRVLMAAATIRQNQIGKIQHLHLSGVATDRSDRGHMAMRSFLDIIEADKSLRSFAWSILLATYSSRYLRTLPNETLQRFIQHICENNTPSGLLSLFRQSEITDETDPWHVKNIIERIDPELIGQRMKICVGEHDEMAPVEFASTMNRKLVGNHRQLDVLSGCGHAVTVESPRQWRESLLSLLDS